MKFRFPNGSWDQELKKTPSGYVAMWEDNSGSYIEELDSDEVEEDEDYTEEDYAYGYISDPGAYYSD